MKKKKTITICDEGDHYSLRVSEPMRAFDVIKELVKVLAIAMANGVVVEKGASPDELERIAEECGEAVREPVVGIVKKELEMRYRNQSAHLSAKELDFLRELMKRGQT